MMLIRTTIRAAIIATILQLQPGEVYGQNIPPESAVVLVTYFHATIRCQGCLTIENFAEESMKYLFGKELQSGKVAWRVLDFEKDTTGRYAAQYKIENQALIVSKYRNGKEIKWKRLDKVWDLLDDYRKFQEYVGKNVREYL